MNDSSRRLRDPSRRLSDPSRRLSDPCRRFRDRFMPGSQDAHRDHCEECASFADILETSSSPEARRPLSASLRRRLRDIPQREVGCRDQRRLYQTALQRATGRGTADTAATRHLETCDRCRLLYLTLQSGFTAETRPLSARLARGLKSITKHPQRMLPLWIQDTRYAAAACYLLAALTLGLADDASAVFRETTDTVSTKTVAWATTGEAHGLAAWKAMTASLGESLGERWAETVRYGKGSERLLRETYRTLEERTHEWLPGRDRSVE